jgi:hypothetical protein
VVRVHNLVADSVQADPPLTVRWTALSPFPPKEPARGGAGPGLTILAKNRLENPGISGIPGRYSCK